MRQILKNTAQKGFTLVEILISVGVIATLMGGVATYVKLTGDVKRKLDMGLVLENVRENLTTTINSPGAWNMTVEKNSNLECLKINSPGCTNGATGDISIYSISGEIVNASAPNAGFDRTGTPCNTFNATAGDAACVFKYRIQWVAQCTFAPCRDPQVRIVTSLLYSPNDPKLKDEVHTDKYSFSFYRSETVHNPIEAVCVSLGGIFDSATNSCQLPWAGFSCPAGQMLRGLNSANIPQCYNPASVSCGAGGGLMRAIRPDGTAFCAALSCSSWTAPTGWIEEPPGLTFDDWTNSGGGDGGCDGGGGDGGCGGGS